MWKFFPQQTGVLLLWHSHSGHIQSNAKLRSGTVTHVFVTRVGSTMATILEIKTQCNQN
jgi:hypothetical protein